MAAYIYVHTELATFPGYHLTFCIARIKMGECIITYQLLLE